MKRITVMMLTFSLLAVSGLPPLSVGGRAHAATYCPLCHMAMASMQHQQHMLTPAMRHCRIECCGHHDSGALPHLLAPHMVSQAGFNIELVMMTADAGMPALKPSLLPFPDPPPRIS